MRGRTNSGQLDASGIRPLNSAKGLQREAYKAWFVGLTFNTVAGLYTLWKLKERQQKIDLKEGEGVVENKKITRYASRQFGLMKWLICLQRAERNELAAHL